MWENAIAEQEEAEENFIMKHREIAWDTNLETLVESIRNGPEYFQDNEQVTVRELAAKAANVIALKAEINKLFSRNNASHSFLIEHDDSNGDIKLQGMPTKSPIHNKQRNGYDDDDDDDDDTSLADSVNGSPGTSTGRYTAKFSQWVTKVSTRWAGRLQNVNHLQGVFRAVDNSNESALKVKPTWPEWLVDVTYEVMKRSVYGKLQRRTLKLTQYHLLNVRNGIQITKSFKYKQLHDLYLRNENSFIIKCLF